MFRFLSGEMKKNLFRSRLPALIFLMAIALLIIVPRQLFLFPPAPQADCGECPNPLVEMKNLRMGEISTVADLFKQLAKEFYGWEEEDMTPQDVILRGFNFLEFKKENPCADMYYTEMRWTGEEEEEIRYGVQQGTAKYCIQSALNMVKAQPGEKAWVARPVYDDKGDLISIRDELVPKMGTVHVHHELTCLKNGETYDEGDLRLDWLPEPPPDEIYGHSEKGGDGIIVGLFSKGSIAGLPIELSKGDVGKTIRNKETPSSFSLDVEEEPLYPPYYKLDIHTIRNLLGEGLPNKILVALRVKYGEIEGGRKIQGWQVFPTEGGKIASPVLYKVPQCSQTNKDTVEMAAYCDWHAGEAMVGKPRASQTIPIPECFNLSLTLSHTDYNFREREIKVDQPSFFAHEKEVHESMYEASIFVTFKKEPKAIRQVSKDTLLYVYDVESWEVGPYNIFYRAQEDERNGSWVGISYENHRQDWQTARIQRADLGGHGELIFTYDRKNEKIIEVQELPAFETYLMWTNKRQSRTYTPETGWTSDDKSEQLEEYHGGVGPSPKAHTVSGDGRRYLMGDTRKEKVTPPTQESSFTTISGREVETQRWELRKR